VPFDNSITGNFTVYEDRFKQFIAAIRPHRNSKSFSRMFVIIFGVNIAAEQKQGQLVMIFLFCISFHCLLITCPTVVLVLDLFVKYLCF